MKKTPKKKMCPGLHISWLSVVNLPNLLTARKLSLLVCSSAHTSQIQRRKRDMILISNVKTNLSLFIIWF